MNLGSSPVRISSANLADYARRVLAECTSLTANKTETRRISLPFLEIEARFTDSGYASSCDRGLISGRVETDTTDTVHLIVADGETEGTPASASWGEAFLLPLEVEKLLAASNLRGSFFHDSRIWEFYDLDARIGASIAPTSTAYPPWESSAPLRTLLHWAYLGIGLRLVHAATLGLDGRGALIAGAGGAGKSGLTLAGIVAGLDSVGDDYVLVDPRQHPKAYPIFRMAKTDEAGRRRLGLDNHIGDLGPTNWQDKYEFDFARLGRGKRVDCLEIEAILVPRITDQPGTSIRPVNAREAMLALAPSGILQLPGDRQSGARVYGALVRQLPCYRVDVGHDPAAAAEAIADFLRGGNSR